VPIPSAGWGWKANPVYILVFSIIYQGRFKILLYGFAGMGKKKRLKLTRLLA
jgi:hypothetical protein